MEARSLILSSEQFREVSAYDLLCAAEQGFAGIDHRFLHALVDEPEKSLPDLVRFGLEARPNAGEDLSDDLINIFRHLRTPQAIPYFLACLRRNHLDSTIPLICAFREVGEPAVEPLQPSEGDGGKDMVFKVVFHSRPHEVILEPPCAARPSDPVHTVRVAQGRVEMLGDRLQAQDHRIHADDRHKPEDHVKQDSTPDSLKQEELTQDDQLRDELSDK